MINIIQECYDFRTHIKLKNTFQMLIFLKYYPNNRSLTNIIYKFYFLKW